MTIFAKILRRRCLTGSKILFGKPSKFLSLRHHLKALKVFQNTKQFLRLWPKSEIGVTVS